VQIYDLRICSDGSVATIREREREQIKFIPVAMVLIKTLRDVLMRDNARRQVKKQLMLQTSCIFYNRRQKTANFNPE